MVFRHKIETQPKIKFKNLWVCQLPIYEGSFDRQNEREHTSSVTAPGAFAIVRFQPRGKNTEEKPILIWEFNSHVLDLSSKTGVEFGQEK